MKMYRLTKKIFAASPFDPIGSKTYGGRWNSKGTEALYFSESESLCSLEVFVHINNDPDIINFYDLYSIEIPDHLIAKLDQEDLPPTWRAIPASEATQEIGDQFLNASQSEFAALQVPSIISPRDKNYIVNPNHSGIAEVFDKAEKLEFEFDPRVFK
jgi:RES domain-containing protein